MCYYRHNTGSLVEFKCLCTLIRGSGTGEQEKKTDKVQRKICFKKKSSKKLLKIKGTSDFLEEKCEAMRDDKN